MNHDEIKAFFQKDRFAALAGAVINSVTEEEVVCSLTIDDRHLNAGDIVQGGAVFTLADFALAVACNYEDLKENRKNISVSHACNIVFLKPAAGKKLIARSRCVQKGRKLSVYRVAVTDDAGTAVAEMTGSAYTVSREGK